MAEKHDPGVSTSARRYVVAGYVLLIVYASLSPFTGWRDQGFTFAEVLTAPLSLTYSVMDAWVNVVAYIPFGLLVAMTLLPRLRAHWSVALTLVAGLALSAAMEFLQMYLPTRTSSNLDILTNSAGALAGALFAVRIAPTPWFAALNDWRRARIRRGPGADFGLALVALWMFVQVNPSLPMLGNIFISETQRAPFQPVPAEPFSWLATSAAALNLLMLGCLYLTLLRRRRRHVLSAVVLSMSLVAVGKFVAAALLFNSWALLLWLNGESMLGIVAGMALLAGAARLSPRMVSVCAAAAALAYLAEDMLQGGVPPGVARLYHGPEGHFTAYNGLSHLILLLFPLLLLGYLWRARKWSRLPV